MIPYIGCVSREDATLLQSLAERADRILEFGSGASTQIFAEYGRGTVDSVETDPAWVERTKRNLAILDIKGPVTFHDARSFKPRGAWDLIFVDCVDDMRESAALMSWPHLAVGGVICFHDTRRTVPHGTCETSDVQHVCAVVAAFSPEIASVILNQNDSNTTVITKRLPLLYENWQVSEGRTDAQMGLQ
jgi:predicted O-methyltransferase YrrM